MKTAYRTSFQSRIPGYSQNAILQLIVASGVGFITYHLIRVVLMIADANPTIFTNDIAPNLTLPTIQHFVSKIWTLLTYGWIHNGFWEWFSNMIWLYCFGSVLQMLIGYKQIIPLFVYGLLAGGLFYEFSQLIPGGGFVGRHALVGAQAGIVALAVAALTVAPNYRYHLTPTFSIPLVAIACIFFALSVMNSDLEGPTLSLLIGGAAMGYGYIKLLQNGYKPGIWVYEVFEKMDSMVTPKENSAIQSKKRNEVLNKVQQNGKVLTEKKIDDILDKINQQGYHSLTKEEREILLKAGKEND